MISTAAVRAFADLAGGLTASRGRQGAACREQVEGACVVCGRLFAGLKTRKHCDDRCRQRAWRKRQRAG